MKIYASRITRRTLLVTGSFQVATVLTGQGRSFSTFPRPACFLHSKIVLGGRCSTKGHLIVLESCLGGQAIVVSMAVRVIINGKAIFL
jgi:hypothetical protein